jgi:glycosyltransferase involved in cell wall biosynthesis
MVEITAVLLNYRRQQNMERLVDSLVNQTIRPEIMLINNSPEQIDIQGVDRCVHIPWNAGCWARLLFARYAIGRWILFIDDDIYPRDDGLLEYLLGTAPQGIITGAVGRVLGHEEPYYRRDIIKGYAHIIKGRFMFFEKRLLDDVPLSTYDGEHDVRFLEDIYLSLKIGRCQPVHRVDNIIRLIEVNPSSRDGVGISEVPGHAQRRNAFCKWCLQ